MIVLPKAPLNKRQPLFGQNNRVQQSAINFQHKFPSALLQQLGSSESENYSLNLFFDENKNNLKNWKFLTSHRGVFLKEGIYLLLRGHVNYCKEFAELACAGYSSAMRDKAKQIQDTPSLINSNGRNAVTTQDTQLLFLNPLAAEEAGFYTKCSLRESTFQRRFLDSNHYSLSKSLEEVNESIEPLGGVDLSLYHLLTYRELTFRSVFEPTKICLIETGEARLLGSNKAYYGTFGSGGLMLPNFRYEIMSAKVFIIQIECKYNKPKEQETAMNKSIHEPIRSFSNSRIKLLEDTSIANLKMRTQFTERPKHHKMNQTFQTSSTQNPTLPFLKDPLLLRQCENYTILPMFLCEKNLKQCRKRSKVRDPSKLLLTNLSFIARKRNRQDFKSYKDSGSENIDSKQMKSTSTTTFKSEEILKEGFNLITDRKKGSLKLATQRLLKKVKLQQNILEDSMQMPIIKSICLQDQSEGLLSPVKNISMAY